MVHLLTFIKKTLVLYPKFSYSISQLVLLLLNPLLTKNASFLTPILLCSSLSYSSKNRTVGVKPFPNRRESPRKFAANQWPLIVHKLDPTLILRASHRILNEGFHNLSSLRIFSLEETTVLSLDLLFVPTPASVCDDVRINKWLHSMPPLPTYPLPLKGQKRSIFQPPPASAEIVRV